MLCQCCRGLLVRESFEEWNVKTNALCPATRCINCGDIEDAVVRANHLRSMGSAADPADPQDMMVGVVHTSVFLSIVDVTRRERL